MKTSIELGLCPVLDSVGHHLNFSTCTPVIVQQGSQLVVSTAAAGKQAYVEMVEYGSSSSVCQIVESYVREQLVAG